MTLKRRRLTKKYLQQICTLNPSPWDDKRFMLRSPTYEELLAIPDVIKVIEKGQLPGPYPDQGEWGACVGWSWSLWLRITNTFLDDIPDIVSAWDTYQKARQYDDLADWMGEGSNNLGGAKALQKVGVCSESCLPTITLKSQTPPTPCSAYGSPLETYGIDAYYQVPVTMGSLRAAMWGTTSDPQWGGRVPVVFGTKIPNSFKDTGEDGIVPMPLHGEQVLGGHSMLAAQIIRIDGKYYVGCPNTWGKDRGDNGWYWLPEEYVTGGWIMDAWVGHNGLPIGGDPDVDSTCPVATFAAGSWNAAMKIVGSQNRMKTVSLRR